MTKFITNTKEIATDVNRRHQDILESVRKLDFTNNFISENFVGSSYTDSRGKAQPMYILTVQAKDYLLARMSNIRKPKNLIEKEIIYELHNYFGGEMEVIIPAGRIDLITDDSIIEVKEINNWKHAIGQVLAYKESLSSDKEPVIFLFGEVNNEQSLDLINSVCGSLSISVMFDNYTSITFVSQETSLTINEIKYIIGRDTNWLLNNEYEYITSQHNKRDILVRLFNKYYPDPYKALFNQLQH